MGDDTAQTCFDAFTNNNNQCTDNCRNALQGVSCIPNSGKLSKMRKFSRILWFESHPWKSSARNLGISHLPIRDNLVFHENFSAKCSLSTGPRRFSPSNVSRNTVCMYMHTVDWPSCKLTIITARTCSLAAVLILVLGALVVMPLNVVSVRSDVHQLQLLEGPLLFTPSLAFSHHWPLLDWHWRSNDWYYKSTNYWKFNKIIWHCELHVLAEIVIDDYIATGSTLYNFVYHFNINSVHALLIILVASDGTFSLLHSEYINSLSYKYRIEIFVGSNFRG
jgi:hypothetical protein